MFKYFNRSFESLLDLHKLLTIYEQFKYCKSLIFVKSKLREYLATGMFKISCDTFLYRAFLQKITNLR